VRLLRAEVPEREGRGALAEPEEPHRAADRWWRGASKVRPEGQVLGAASPVAAGGYQVQEVHSRRCTRSHFAVPLRGCAFVTIIMRYESVDRQTFALVSRSDIRIMMDPSINLRWRTTRWRNTTRPSLPVEFRTLRLGTRVERGSTCNLCETASWTAVPSRPFDVDGNLRARRGGSGPSEPGD